ncbi:MAG: isopeptide-forming domain-containing fimbrial protein, partial [Pseudomonadota bacterium]
MNKRFPVMATAALLLLLSVNSFAQTPQITQTVPNESFLGETFCFETELTNIGPAGFGPYLRLVLPPELSFDSATIFGSAVDVQNVGVFPPAPGNELIDPVIDQPVTGPEGGSLVILTYPVGSVVEDGPPLPIETCLTMQPGAQLGVPIPIEITPVYQFGDTATGANGPIVGTPITPSVTPTVLMFSKANSAPEDERPPGPSWPIDYTLTVDIANTATINPLLVTDQLPPDFQFTGPFTINGGGGCSATQTPSTILPGGLLEVECTNDIVGSLAENDVEIIYTGFITDILDESNCGTSPIENMATVQASYVPASGPVQVLPPIDADSTVTARHVAVQKSAAPTAVTPGDAVTYTLRFQVTDFGTGNALVVTDTLPDGVSFDSHGQLTVEGGAVAIVPSVTVNPDFTTTVIYDIGAVAGSINPGADITLSYNATLEESFQNPDPDQPILSSDSLTNSVSIIYGLPAGAAACGEGSSATIDVNPVSVDKEIVNLQPFYLPGETVQFRLTLNVPTGDTSDIVFEDFLPLPVFVAGDVDLSFDPDGVFSNDGDIVRGPADTAGLTPTSITSSAGSNSIRIEWPDV